MTIDFVQDAPRPQRPMVSRPFHQWLQPDQTLWAQFFRTAPGYVVRFPGLADFKISEDGTAVRGWPVEGTSVSSVQHLFLNQISPLALSRSGKLMFHASAVAVADFCVAFLGASGRGKSTLAASFAAEGVPFLTDDGLSVEWERDRCFAAPSHPSIRLWQDSERAVLKSRATQAPPVQYTEKARFLAEDALAFCAERQELKLIYVLGPGESSAPVFERLGPAASVVELIKNSFLLDIDEQGALARHFEELTCLAQLRMLFRFDYPRDYEALEVVRAAILKHAMAHIVSDDTRLEARY